MKTIYVDSNFHCHISNDGTMTAVETEFFDGKCDTFVEGYCLEPTDGNGEKMYPWEPLSKLDAAQREYEQEKLADAENALAILFGGETA
jgi:hypothetical protein